MNGHKGLTFPQPLSKGRAAEARGGSETRLQTVRDVTRIQTRATNRQQRSYSRGSQAIVLQVENAQQTARMAQHTPQGSGTRATNAIVGQVQALQGGLPLQCRCQRLTAAEDASDDTSGEVCWGVLR